MYVVTVIIKDVEGRWRIHLPRLYAPDLRAACDAAFKALEGRGMDFRVTISRKA